MYPRVDTQTCKDVCEGGEGRGTYCQLHDKSIAMLDLDLQDTSLSVHLSHSLLLVCVYVCVCRYGD